MNASFIKLLFVSIIFLIFNSFFEPLKSNQPNEFAQLNWNEIKSKDKNRLIWKYEEDNESENNNYKDAKYLNQFNKQRKKITAIGKSIKIDGILYPEISSYVPNAFVEDEQKLMTISVRGISATRGCETAFNLTCSDAVLFSDINLYQNEKVSFNINWAMQSLSNRNGGTKFGEGQTLGFKSAFKLNNKWSLAIGGDNVVLFDEYSDLGRNLYLIAGTYIPINKSYLIFNAGIGSDFFGYRGNGYLARTKCIGKPNLTGEGENSCTWGPITSISFVFNEKLALVNEWFGYGFGTGLSFKPLRESTLNFSLYATDYLGNFPKYIKKSCHNESCTPRFYANFSISI